MAEGPGDGKRRGGWLWIWLGLFVVLILVLLFWALPARQPPGDADRDVSVSAVGVAPGAQVTFSISKASRQSSSCSGSLTASEPSFHGLC